MLHGCHMSIVGSQVSYTSWMSLEYSGLPGYESNVLPPSLHFEDVI